jgi:hypothetical protein
MDVIGICNMAIGFVGGSSIMSLVDETVEAEQCDLYYDAARAFCLESRDWTFAAKTRQLAQDASPVSTEFAYSFTLPSDCLVVRSVSSNSDLRYPLEYQKDGNAILTDSTIVYVKYTKDITTTTLFSPSFAIAVAHKLGEYLASVLTGDKVLKRTLMQESEAILEGGGAIDGMQGSPKRAFASRLLNSRYRYGATRYGLGSSV